MDENGYFIELVKYSSDLLNRLPIELTPQPLDYTLQKLMPKLQEIAPAEIPRIAELKKPTFLKPTSQQLGTGLNSVGMLTDRLTILIIREWCLRNKGKKDGAKAAQHLYETQILDI